MPNEYRQVTWGPETEFEAERLVAEAKREDLGDGQDWTSLAVTTTHPRCRTQVIARGDTVLCGLHIFPIILRQFGASLQFSTHAQDGATLRQGEVALTIEGTAYDLLSVERTLLNFLGHLSGVATATSRYVAQVQGTSAKIYDTRKTLPGWRFLQKYAVHSGGGHNHRLGLHDAILIKDNHIALVAEQAGVTLEEAPVRAMEAARALAASKPSGLPWLASNDTPDAPGKLGVPLEIEVDSLDQLQRVLPSRPDIVLLDNMSPDQLREAVAMRDSTAREVVLEASGRVNLETVREIALTGVDRISVGALTHSVSVADFGMDWLDA